MSSEMETFERPRCTRGWERNPLQFQTPASEKILLSQCNHIPSRMKDKLLCLVSTPKSEAQYLIYLFVFYKHLNYSTDIKSTISEYYKSSYNNKFENLDEMSKFHIRHK